MRPVVALSCALALSAALASAAVAAPAESAADNSQRSSEPAAMRYPVWWHAPFLGGTGYGSEALQFVFSLVRSGAMRRRDVWVALHGDGVKKDVAAGMAPEDRSDLEEMQRNVDRDRPAIIVCHSLPTNWMLPSPMSWVGEKCPPDVTDAAYVYLIGRTMFETDRLPPSFVPRCNAMNEVWVPSTFSRDVFVASGVDARKIRVVPEGVNTTYYDRAKHRAMPMPQGELVFGPPPPARHNASARAFSLSGVASATHPPAAAADSISGAARGSTTTTTLVGGHQQRSSITVTRRRPQPALLQAADPVTSQQQAQAPGGGMSDARGVVPQAAGRRRPFRFLSTFKWEARKAWDVLLDAFLSEFTAQDHVELLIITKPFMTATGKDFKQQMHAWAERQARARWDREHGAAWAAYEAALRQQQEAERQARDAPDRDDAGEEAQEEEGPAPQDVPELEDPLDDAQHDASAPLAAAAALPPLPSPPPPFTFNTSALPRLRVVHHHIPDHDLPRFYKAADCFVLPSRGEGWGRPHVEAMSMGLSVIATNWSGVTAFLDETTGYPIKVESLVPANPKVWWFRGLRWAQPSVQHLRQLMRHVVENRAEARRRGAAARRRMVELYSPEATGRLVAAELRRVNDLIP